MLKIIVLSSPHSEAASPEQLVVAQVRLLSQETCNMCHGNM